MSNEAHTTKENTAWRRGEEADYQETQKQTDERIEI